MDGRVHETDHEVRGRASNSQAADVGARAPGASEISAAQSNQVASWVAPTDGDASAEHVADDMRAEQL